VSRKEAYTTFLPQRCAGRFDPHTDIVSAFGTPQMQSLTPKGTALVTGASSGIGALYADRLAHAGFDLILVARRVDRLRALAEALTTRTGRSIEVLAADLTDPVELAGIEDVLRTDASITMLVNNAGIGGTAPLLQSDIAEMDRMIALNVNAPTRLAYAAAPAFVARGRGTIVNIASIVAVAPEVLNGVYGGSKAYVLAFSQSLRRELSDKGVRVQVVLPGATATDFWGVAGMPVEHLPQSMVMSAPDMVDAALAGLAQGEFATIPALPDVAQWEAFEQARNAMTPNLSLSRPAARYGLGESRHAA
jgi:short-subunit dehydrogenase